MKVMYVQGVNDALRMAVETMRYDVNWEEINPRGNGDTMEYSTPIATLYRWPWERVLLDPVRDANPFFHLMEALWMLAGRRDAAWVGQFSSKIGQYAEDDGFFHGAYGARWRSHFAADQIAKIITLLRKEPDTRRAVLAMWDPDSDLGASKRDVPCNTHVYFKLRNNRLNMTVCCRSNDIILGCYGANAVHFSILQEYVALSVGARIGTYAHVSDSWHYYKSNPFAERVMNEEYTPSHNYLSYPDSRLIPLLDQSYKPWVAQSKFDEDLRVFMGERDWHEHDHETVWYDYEYETTFFQQVAVPVRALWDKHMRGVDREVDPTDIAASDWGKACTEWLERRNKL